MKSYILSALAVCALLLLSACATPQQPPIQQVTSLNIGLAPFSQPRTAADMLAGNLPDQLPAIDTAVMTRLDLLFEDTILSKSKRNFAGADVARVCMQQTPRDNAGKPRAAVRYWSAVGRCMQVDYLVVPQLIEWREREGSSMGVTSPARVVMDTFVVDVQNEGLVSRSRYDQTQTALSDNLLQARRFFERGGRWVEAQILAREGMEKAIKELGL